MPDNIKKLLSELKKGLARIYGDQLEGVYLFGSYARGDQHPPDSDIDVLIVFANEFDYREVERRAADFMASLCLENDVLISWVFASQTEYALSKSPLMINVRRESLAV